MKQEVMIDEAVIGQDRPRQPGEIDAQTPLLEDEVGHARMIIIICADEPAHGKNQCAQDGETGEINQPSLQPGGAHVETKPGAREKAAFG